MVPLCIHIGILIAAFLSNHVEGKRDPILYCGACRALVDELLYEIRKVNPKKTVEVGSFRISPDGTQEKTKVPFAKSEQYLTEVLEQICEKMDDYGLYADPETQEKSYKRFAPRDNEEFGSLDFKNFQFNPDESGSLKFACERVVEEHEDEIFSLIAHETDNLADKLCAEEAGLCKEVAHSEL
ncbi:protein canopy homolog 1 [Spea bombifrons]|uniref:protein canopy homolog 1 n=1 Tax=Spea bombifrons TaxID=233779 RepID=UPI00234980A3|nr:protein canopy homolog 1 [Spea bombifrons]XP_053322642.1 protein canopy homolog 1 [Spea bombifrons]XP_053322643.1 protein canopy homolog 1 [Spea bombifrons]